MKRSEINEIIQEASLVFERNGWALPPNPKWDVTDFGLGDFFEYGLVLVNLAEEPEYCEKLMYARKNQITPSHFHKVKKEDIIVRAGHLAVQLWVDENDNFTPMRLKVTGEVRNLKSGDILYLSSGERVTIEPGVLHAFYPTAEGCVISEVSTANDDVNDNFFQNDEVGRYATIEEDEAPVVKLISDK